MGYGKKAHSSLAKTPALKKYELDFISQIPGQIRNINLSKAMKIKLYCTFKSKRPDLDNAPKAILDILQIAGVIKNDNLVYDLHLTKAVDKDNPRVDIEIEEY